MSIGYDWGSSIGVGGISSIGKYNLRYNDKSFIKTQLCFVLPEGQGLTKPKLQETKQLAENEISKSNIYPEFTIYYYFIILLFKKLVGSISIVY